MSIIADENMAALAPLFADYGDIKTFPGRDIDPHHVGDSTKVMLLRSVTKVDAALLDAAPNLEFIGTATIGTDHFDIPQIEERRVRWSNAPGCNAQGVGEYVLSSLLLLAQRSDEDLQTKTIGIVGLGNTGTAVARRLQALGYTIMCCDPPRQQRGDAGQWYSLEQIIAQCDVITLHVPLSSDTFYLLDNQRLSQLQANCWLINASRGEVIDNRALINYKQQQPTLRLVLDVWENEPTPMMELVALAEIATPHIAGYSVEGKIRGSQMLHQALYQGKQTTPTLAELIDVEPLPVVTAPAQLEQQWLAQICATVYDIAQEDLRFRSALPTGFDARRKANLARREFSAQRIIGAPAGMATTLSELGFTI